MDLTHFNEDGLPRMVDVSEKETTKRVAVAHSRIYMKKETMQKNHRKIHQKRRRIECRTNCGDYGCEENIGNHSNVSQYFHHWS